MEIRTLDEKHKNERVSSGNDLNGNIECYHCHHPSPKLKGIRFSDLLGQSLIGSPVAIYGLLFGRAPSQRDHIPQRSKRQHVADPA